MEATSFFFVLVQVLFDIPFLSVQKKTCLLIGDMPALISECDSANSILVHKQTDVILDTDKAVKANPTWKTLSARLD